jgi:predicted CoA-substrate-specific enzyme activase
MGSCVAKGVLMAGGEALARVRLRHSHRGSLGEDLFDRLLRAARLIPGEVALTLATGYGQEGAPADGVVAEVPCQALGVLQSLPDTRTIIDIGGQDTKVIFLGPGGAIEDFVRNDKCAAGTGRFLERMAGLLGTDPEGFGRLAEASAASCHFRSTCVVFAETEVAGLLASGDAPADIAAGIQTAVAERIRSMIDGDVVAPVTLTGGCALIPGMARRLQAALAAAVRVAGDPQFTCAVGAAALAADRWVSESATARSS